MENTKLYCKEKLENNGFRITPQRLRIFRCLVESDLHPSAEMVYQEVRKEFPNISFDTVNRTLLCLLDKGLIKMVESGHGPRRFDANLKPHYHFRCLYCKRIIDFECPSYDKIEVPESVKKRFKVLRQKIILEGICPACLENRKRENDYLAKQRKLTG
jgi:Fur family transcriptional regulator, peroxide stress response regulator